MPLDDATLRALTNFPDALEAHFALTPPSHRNWRPPSWEGCPSEQQSYATADERQALAAFRLARAQTLELLSGVSVEQLQRPTFFEGYGAVTLKSLVHYLCSHDQQHPAGLQWLLGQIAAAQPSSLDS